MFAVTACPGLDYKSLSPECPRLIYCSVTGFGQDGPYAKRAGYDLMAQGMAGLMDITGHPDGAPTRVGVPISDLLTGCYSVIGILAALAQRERTGKGCHVDTNLVDSTVGTLANQGLNYLISGKVPERMGNTHPNIVPYQEFPTADGHVIVATGNDNQYIKFCNVLGAPQLGQDPNYKNNASRLQHRNELTAKLSALTKRITRDALLAKLEAEGVPAGPINNLQQVFDDPHIKQRGMRIERASVGAKAGKIPGVRTPISFDAWPAAADNGAPQLGQHTTEILKEIGEV